MHHIHLFFDACFEGWWVGYLFWALLVDPIWSRLEKPPPDEDSDG